MKTYLDDHFTHIIEERADKSWEPSLHGCADVVGKYPEIAGLYLMEDGYLAATVVEMRNENGEPMASYTGVQ